MFIENIKNMAENKPSDRVMSAEELRNRLYHSLRQKGLIDSLKSQLRNNLVTELRDNALSKAVPVQYSLTEPEGSLLLRAAHSLVADHLQRCKLDYTLSVFLPESGTSQDKIFAVNDLLQLLSISPHSKLYQYLVNNIADYKKGFLWQLLCTLSSLHGSSSLECGTQTDSITSLHQHSLADKLNSVDKVFSSRIDDELRHGYMATEDRLLAYQKQLEARSREEVKHEIQRFKEGELLRVRINEQEESRGELEKIRRDLESQYKLKCDALLTRERNAIERLQQQQEIQEKEVYSQRQSLLEEIEHLRQKEAQHRREKEALNREQKVQTETFQSKDTLLKKREAAVQRSEAEYDNRLQDDMRRFKLEQEAKYMSRSKELEIGEAKYREENRVLQEEKTALQDIKNELKSKRRLVNELEAELYRAKQELMSSNGSIEVMGEKLRGMVDYQVLREENAVKKRELEDVKMRLAEERLENEKLKSRNEELLREMSDRLSKPTPETFLMQKELERARNALREQEATAEYQKQLLEKRLQDEGERYRIMIRKYEDQTVQLKEMNHEMMDMRQHMQHTKQALSNEVYRNPKSSLPESLDGDNENVNEFIDSLLKTDNEAEIRDILTNSSQDDISGFEDVVGPRPFRVDTSDEDLSTSIIEDTRRRLKTLEQEAENLEQNYLNYQHRATNIHALSFPQGSPRRVTFSDQQAPAINRGPGMVPPVVRPAVSSPIRMGISSPRNTSRQLSSTPHRSGVSRILHSPPTHPQEDGNPSEELPSFNLSQVDDVADPREQHGSLSFPMTTDDLKISSVVNQQPTVEVGGHHSPVGSSSSLSGAARLRSLERSSSEVKSESSPVVKPRSSLEVKPLSASDGAVTPVKEAVVSLDSTWQEQQAVRSREEEEQREWEEKRKQREMERKRKEEEDWERQQRELRELQGIEVEPDRKEVPDVEQKTEEPPTGDVKIDPVMQKYMDMVQQQKEKEKQTEQKPIPVARKERAASQEQTVSLSENDISVADDEKSLNDDVVPDDDFW